MNSNPMRNANHAGQAVPSSSPSYAPSVPISLYREVTAELQATKAALEAIKQQNQQLTQQNRHLHQEIEKAVQSTLNLRQVAQSISRTSGENSAVDERLMDERLTSSRSETLPKLDIAPIVVPATPRAPMLSKLPSLGSPFSPETLVIEQDSKPRRKLLPESESSGNSLGGWWLGVAIALIVVSAFGAGFLIVRPLLPSPASK